MNERSECIHRDICNDRYYRKNSKLNLKESMIDTILDYIYKEIHVAS